MFALLHPDKIKLARGIDQDRRHQAIVGAVVRMCEELDILIITAGIENAKEASALAILVCGIIGITGMRGRSSSYRYGSLQVSFRAARTRAWRETIQRVGVVATPVATQLYEAPPRIG